MVARHRQWIHFGYHCRWRASDYWNWQKGNIKNIFLLYFIDSVKNLWRRSCPNPFEEATGGAVFSFDIKTAGEIAGIVQISAEFVRFKINSAKKTVGSDYADDIERVWREDQDIPFWARNGLEIGWFCEACVKLSADRTPYYLQCTTWKDKKQVSFLSNNKVGRSDGMTVQRRVRGKRTRDTVAAPRAQADYVATMPLTEMTGIVRTTQQPSARIDTTWEFSAGLWTG
jgi:hypothetical protein